MGVGVVSRTLNIDSRLSELFTYRNAWILELAKGVQIIEVGLYTCNRLYTLLLRTKKYTVHNMYIQATHSNKKSQKCFPFSQLLFGIYFKSARFCRVNHF